MITHRSPISGVDARGHYVATAGYDNQVILWDAVTKRSLARGNHEHLVNQCRFSPCGRFLVTASSDYTARVWSVPKLELLSLLRGHGDDVEMASMNVDGERIATASRDHIVRVFNAHGQLEAECAGHLADVLTVEWDRGGQDLLSSSDDGTVRRWCSKTGLPRETISFDGVETDTIALGAGSIIYAGNDEGSIVAIDGSQRRTYNVHRAGIKRLLYDRRRGLLLSASYDRTIKLWHSIGIEDLTPVWSSDVPSNVWLRACAFGGEATVIVGTFGSTFGSFNIPTQSWDLSNVSPTDGLNAVRMVGEDIYAVGDAGVVTKNQHRHMELGSLCNFIGGWVGTVVTGGQLGILFDADSGKEIHAHHSPLNCVASFQKGGAQFIIVGTYTGEGLIFQQYEGSLRYYDTLRLHHNAIKGLACNNSSIFSVCATGAAAIHRIDDFSDIETIPNAHLKISNGVATLADGRFASISRDRQLRIWSPGKCFTLGTPHDHSVKCIAAAATGPLLATGSYDGNVAMFDTQAQCWIYNARISSSGISSLSPTSSPKRFLASCYDGRIYNIPE